MSQATHKWVSLMVVLCPRSMIILLLPHIFTLASLEDQRTSESIEIILLVSYKNLIQNDLNYKEKLISSHSWNSRSKLGFEWVWFCGLCRVPEAQFLGISIFCFSRDCKTYPFRNSPLQFLLSLYGLDVSEAFPVFTCIDSNSNEVGLPSGF